MSLQAACPLRYLLPQSTKLPTPRHRLTDGRHLLLPSALHAAAGFSLRYGLGVTWDQHAAALAALGMQPEVTAAG